MNTKKSNSRKLTYFLLLWQLLTSNTIFDDDMKIPIFFLLKREDNTYFYNTKT